MSFRRARLAPQLALVAALASPLAVSAVDTAGPPRLGAGTSSLPALGPVGLAFLGVGVAGAGLLISRRRRHRDDD